MSIPPPPAPPTPLSVPKTDSTEVQGREKDQSRGHQDLEPGILNHGAPLKGPFRGLRVLGFRVSGF